MSTRDDGADVLLRAAGWLPSERTEGWWIDPASGEHLPEWRALDLAARDARRAREGSAA